MPKARDRLFFAAVLAACFTLFSLSLGGFGVGNSIYFVLLYVISAVYLWPWKIKRGFPVLCGVLGFMLSLGFSISAYQPAISFLSVIAVEVLYLIFIGGITDNLVYGSETLAVSKDAVRIIFNDAIEECGAPFRSNRKKADGAVVFRNLVKISLGISVSVPVIAVVLPLLMEANPTFDKFLTAIFKARHNDTLWHVLGALALAPFTCGMLFSQKYKKAVKKKKTDEGFKKWEGFDSVGVLAFISVISALYVLYVISQFSYFFSAFSGEIPDAVKTAADYARKGFFELCIVSAINFVLMLIVLFKTKTGGVYKYCRALAVFVAGFSAMLIITALSKMLLYIKLYGLTVRRILPSVFMLVLLFAFALAVVRVYVTRLPYMRYFAVFCAVLLILMSYADIGAVAANYNVNAYLNEDYAWHTESIEIDYLRELGVSAVPALVRLAEETDDEAVRGNALSAAHVIMKSRSEEEKTEWKRFNINSYLAERAYSDIEDIEK